MRVFSHSRLSTFETCPMQYRLRYVDQVDVHKRESIESFLGRRVHETLQILYDRLRAGMRVSERDLLAQLAMSWDRNWHKNVKIVRQDQTVEDYRAFADRCVRNYYRANDPFNRNRTVGTEVEIEFALDAERQVHIRGYIDRLDQAGPGVYEIHDYKTTRRLPFPEDVQRDRQLAFYQMWVVGKMPDAREIRLVWHYLAFGRRIVSRRSPDELSALRAQTTALIDRIDEAVTREDFPARVSRLCDWCEYRPVCPAWVATQERFKFEYPVTISAPTPCRVDAPAIPRVALPAPVTLAAPLAAPSTPMAAEPVSSGLS